jgi:hypothetical protein
MPSLSPHFKINTAASSQYILVPILRTTASFLLQERFQFFLGCNKQFAHFFPLPVA